MLHRKVPIDRTRHEIERDFATKKRIEYSDIPPEDTASRGERHLFAPNSDDDYFIINTRHGFKVGQFIAVETSLPSNSIGRDGEIRILDTSSYKALLYKSDGAWYMLDATVIGSKLGIDTMVLGTGGCAPNRLVKPTTLGTGGAHQN